MEHTTLLALRALGAELASADAACASFAPQPQPFSRADRSAKEISRKAFRRSRKARISAKRAFLEG